MWNCVEHDMRLPLFRCGELVFEPNHRARASLCEPGVQDPMEPDRLAEAKEILGEIFESVGNKENGACFDIRIKG